MAKNVKTEVVKKNNAAKKAVKRDLSNVNPELTDAFIQEVDEDVKNDNMKEIWKRYGVLIVAIVVIAVSAAVSFDRIRMWKVAQNQRRTQEYMAAAQLQQSPEDTMAALQKISQNNQGIYSDFAKMQMANLLLTQNKTEEALNVLENLINDKQVNTEVKHIAVVKLATYKVDLMSKKELEKLLAPVMEENSSWMPIAQDLLALSAIKEGDLETARIIYENVLKIKDLPESFKSKVQDMLSALNDI